MKAYICTCPCCKIADEKMHYILELFKDIEFGFIRLSGNISDYRHFHKEAFEILIALKNKKQGEQNAN